MDYNAGLLRFDVELKRVVSRILWISSSSRALELCLFRSIRNNSRDVAAYVLFSLATGATRRDDRLKPQNAFHYLLMTFSNLEP